MKLKRCIEDAYIMGLKTVEEAYFSVCRNSHLYFKEGKENMELEELERELRSYNDDELITEILSKREMDDLDRRLEEDLR